MAEVADVLEDAAPLRVAKRASGAVSPIPGTASLGQSCAFVDRQRIGRSAPEAVIVRDVITRATAAKSPDRNWQPAVPYKPRRSACL